MLAEEIMRKIRMPASEQELNDERFELQRQEEQIAKLAAERGNVEILVNWQREQEALQKLRETEAIKNMLASQEVKRTLVKSMGGNLLEKLKQLKALEKRIEWPGNEHIQLKDDRMIIGKAVVSYFETIGAIRRTFLKSAEN